MIGEPVSKHAEVVHHLHRHTELRKLSAEEAVRRANDERRAEQEQDDQPAGG